jgi:ABC-type antimicrobial peptide transport system permease subunit
MISRLKKLNEVYGLFLEFLRSRPWMRLAKLGAVYNLIAEFFRGGLQVRFTRLGEVRDSFLEFLQGRPDTTLTADVIKLAFRRLYRNKRRYWAAVLASALGIAGFTLALTLSEAVETKVASDLEFLGSATIIEATWDYERSPRFHHGSYSLKDVEDLRRLPNVVEVAPVLWKWKQKVEYRKNESTARIAGVDGSYFRAVALSASIGRQLNEQDNSLRRQVCTLGKEVAKDLFEDARAGLGKIILIRGIPFEVIGILAWNADPKYETTVMIPFSIAQARITGMDTIEHVRVRAKDWDSVPGLVEQVRAVLTGNQKPYAEAISVKWYNERIAHIKYVAFMLRFFAIAASLVVLTLGSLSIYSLMNATVTERTREIGLITAVGALPRTIMFQFLCESMTVSSIGALAGIIIGYLGAVIGWAILGAESNYSSFFWGLTASCVVGVAMGLFSGLAPARKASKIDCVEAITFE